MTNLFVASASFIVFTLLVLVVAHIGKSYLFGLSIVFILVSNITVQMSAEIIPGMTISWAIIIYSLVYLITDLIIEFYGRKEAFKLAGVNLGVQMVLWLYVWLSLMAIPAESGASKHVYETMKSLFATTTQVTLAAVLASIGPFADIFITTKIRVWLARRPFFRNDIANLLARAKLSTLLGEVINTVIFFGVALIGTGMDLRSQLSIIISATVAKWAIAVADMPFLWVFFQYFGPPPDAILRHDDHEEETVR